MRRKLALLILLLAPLLAAGPGFLFRTIEVRIEGFLDASEAAVNPWTMLQVQVGEGPVRNFALTNLIVLTSGATTGADIVAQVQPIHPSFIFNGESGLLEQISTARPNEYLKIWGTTVF